MEQSSIALYNVHVWCWLNQSEFSRAMTICSPHLSSPYPSSLLLSPFSLLLLFSLLSFSTPLSTPPPLTAADSLLLWQTIRAPAPFFSYNTMGFPCSVGKTQRDQSRTPPPPPPTHTHTPTEPVWFPPKVPLGAQKQKKNRGKKNKKTYGPPVRSTVSSFPPFSWTLFVFFLFLSLLKLLFFEGPGRKEKNRYFLNHPRLLLPPSLSSPPPPPPSCPQALRVIA